MPAQKEGRKLVQAWIPDDAASQLKSWADDAERSVAAELRIAVRSHLNDKGPLPQAAPVKESARQGRHGAAY